MPKRVLSQLLRFAIVGVAGLVVDVIVLYLALALGCGPYLGRVVSFMAAAFATWLLNRRFTFAETADVSMWRQWWRYLLAMSGGGLVNYVVYGLVLPQLPEVAWAPLAAVAAGSVSGLVVNFSSAKWLVFKK